MPGEHATTAAAHCARKPRTLFASIGFGSPPLTASSTVRTSLSATKAPSGPSDFSQPRSCGTMRVATRPLDVAGALLSRRRVALRASIASARMAPGMSEVRTHELTVDARDSMSVSSNESAPWCQVDWSPTTLMTGELARRALWRLARALASPGPRCRRVHAGLRAIRAYPSAAPLTTVSWSARTGRIASGPRESSAPTSHISVVPGFAKHTSTPPSCRARTRASAPFLGGARGEIEDGPRGAMATRGVARVSRRGVEARNGRPT